MPCRCDHTSCGCDHTTRWCDHYSCFFLMRSFYRSRGMGQIVANLHASIVVCVGCLAQGAVTRAELTRWHLKQARHHSWISSALKLSFNRPGQHLSRPARVSRQCVFITAGSLIKLCAGGAGGQSRTCAMRYNEPRHVWTSLPKTH